MMKRSGMPDLFSQPEQEVARRRDDILLKVEVASGVEFAAKVRHFIVEHLRRHGPCSGEDITNAAKASGILPPPGRDDRCFGPQYMALSRRGIILKAGHCSRRKGHLCNGGIIWKLHEPNNPTP